MRLVIVLSILLGLLRIPTLSKADEDVYFEGSGEPSDFPTDDEDNEEGSGFSFEGEEEEPTIDVIKGPNEEEDGDDKIRVRLVDNDNVSETPEVEKDDDLDNEKAEQELDGRDQVNVMTPHFIAAVAVGGCIGLLFAVCVIMLLVYRMRKKDEGSYALEYGLDGKKPQGSYEYTKGVDSKEYYA